MKYVQCVELWRWKNGDAAMLLENLSQLIGLLFFSDSSANF